MSSKQRWLIIALVISVAVNLMFAGAIIGRIVTGGPPGPLPHHVGWMVRSLDEARRQELRDEMIDHVRETRPLRRDMFRAQRRLTDAISSREFDEARVRDALAAVRESQRRWQEAVHDQMVDVLSRLNPAERRHVALYLRRDGRPGGERHRP